MKANYKEKEGTSSSMSREDRRAVHKRLKPVIKRIVQLEKDIKANLNKEEAEAEIAQIMETLNMIEMMAVEDYIYNHKLL